MDQGLLVASGRHLIELLSKDQIPPRAAIWVRSSDTDTWRLWMVPHQSINDKREFYRRVATLVSRNRDKLHGLEASDVEMVSENHPLITALRRMFRVTGKSDAHIEKSMLDGYYIPDGIILYLDD